MIDQTQRSNALQGFSEHDSVTAITRTSLFSAVRTTANSNVLDTAGRVIRVDNASVWLAESGMSGQRTNDSWDVDYLDELSYYNDSQDYVFDSTYSSPHVMPWPQRASWITVFTIMLLVATVGNALVTWIVLAHRRMKTVTNYFLVNLSLADLTMSLFNCVFNFVFMLNSHWPFGEFYCTVSNFIANVTVAASVFTLVAISFDRFIAIVYPLRPRMSKCIARIAISIIWLASFILATPCLLYSRLLPHSYPDGATRIACIMIWPDGLPNVSRQDFIYNIIFTVLTYMIPVCVMAICYSRMSYILWRSESIGELSQRQAESIQSKRKVVRMFIVVVMLFAICWLPYHGYFVYQYIDHHVISYKYVQHIFLAFYWLAMSNAMINPLVYYYMNARFRQYFKTVICQRPCYRRRGSASGTDLAGAAGRFANGAHPRSSAEHSVPPGLVPYLHALRQRPSSSEKGLQVIGPIGVKSVDQSSSSKSTQHPNTQSNLHHGHQRCQIFAKLNENQHHTVRCSRRGRHHHFHIHFHHHHYFHDRRDRLHCVNGSPERFTDSCDHHLIALWLPSLSVPNRLSEQKGSPYRMNDSYFRPSSEGCLKKTTTTDTAI